VFTRCQNSLGSFAQAILAVGLGFAALTASFSSAAAQNSGFFESLFGGKRWNNGPTAYADPFQQFNPFGPRPAETTPRAATGSGDGGSVAFCVRTCDGRYFPIQRHSGITPAQACSSFCPASQTKIYNGGTIDTASGSDGKRYADLSTAFVYREKIVPGCTCNGKDAFGLVTTPIEEDVTLRQGDIVATSNGLMAYNGGSERRHAANFTPIESYRGLSSDLRRKLTETKIAPAVEAAATPAQIKRVAADVETTGSIRKIKSKRVQLER
jgi:hypothetical protein